MNFNSLLYSVNNDLADANMTQENHKSKTSGRKRHVLPLRKAYDMTIRSLYVELGDSGKKKFWELVLSKGITKTTCNKDMNREISSIPSLTRYLVYRDFFGELLPPLNIENHVAA